ncbi:mu-type opioid receptor-like [Dendronephthya gigantea]|uniref:mu-type opioid receptor-like n=1 Tax=Dendronephthya gigantea TaxID=151771 RepID=UPI00106A88A4|nr:mu-type opioid receptor-like [Dendronephthya gigantea]
MEVNGTVEFDGTGRLRYPTTTGTILFSIEVAFSLIANFLVVFLFACRRRLLCNPHNRCILSLAITDILTSITVFFSPGLVLKEKFQNAKDYSYVTREIYCRFIYSNFLPFALAVTSLYTSVVLAFERWLAVRRSIFYKTSFKIRHMNRLIMASWIAGFTAEVPIMIMMKGVYDQPEENCRYIVAENKVLTLCLSVAFIVFQMVIPLTLITIAYVDTFRGIRASLRFTESARTENINCIKRSKKVTKVAAITTFILTVCWVTCSIPFFVSLLAFDPLNDYQDPLVVVIGLLAFANTCINPCIYVFSNPELRHALKDVLLKNTPQHTQSGGARAHGQ